MKSKYERLNLGGVKSQYGEQEIVHRGLLWIMIFHMIILCF